MLPILIYAKIINTEYEEACEMLTDPTFIKKYPIECEILDIYISLERGNLKDIETRISSQINQINEIGDNLLNLAIIVNYLNYLYQIQNDIEIELAFDQSNAYAILLKQDLDDEEDTERLEKSRIWLYYYYNFIGKYRRRKGMNKVAIQFYEKAYELSKNIIFKEVRAAVLMNIGNLYITQGSFDVSKSYFLQSYSYVESKIVRSTLEMNLGIIAIFEGENKKSEEYLANSLKLLKDTEVNPAHLGSIYLFLCINYLSMNNIEGANTALGFLEYYNNNYDMIILEQFYDLAHALVIKSNKRYVMRSEAYTKLKNLIDQSISDYLLINIIYLNFVDLLLQEFLLYSNKETLDEMEQTLDGLYLLSKNNDAINMMAEILLFKSEIALSNNELTNSYKLLEEASRIIFSENLTLLKDKIIVLKEKIAYKYKDNENYLDRDILLDYIKNIGPIIRSDQDV